MNRSGGKSRVAIIAAWAGIALSLAVATVALRPPVQPPPDDAPAVLDLPSGEQAELMEAFWEDQGDGAFWLRLRFLAPWLDGAPETALAAQDDMLHLCRVVGLPYVAQAPHEVGLIVVSLSEEPIAFGTTDAGVVQFFEAYEALESDCISEDFGH